MNFKTAILSSAAAAFLIASPALAQEIAPAAPATQDAPAQPSLSLTPGTSVHGPDGELGKLEGVQNNASGAQELTVRGADGQLRADDQRHAFLIALYREVEKRYVLLQLYPVITYTFSRCVGGFGMKLVIVSDTITGIHNIYLPEHPFLRPPICR